MKYSCLKSRVYIYISRSQGYATLYLGKLRTPTLSVFLFKLMAYPTLFFDISFLVSIFVYISYILYSNITFDSNSKNLVP